MAGPPVLILGGGLTALGVLRLLGRRGVDAYVWPPATDFVRHSRWYRTAPVPADAAGDDLPGLLDRVGLDRAVLMPVGDSWAMAVAGLDAARAERFPACVPPGEVLTKLVNKLAFAELLARVQVAHPVTVPVARGEDLAGVPEEALARAFLKPHDSQRFFERFGVKGWRVASREEAAARLDQLGAAGLGVVVQEYIPGPPSEHYFVDGFADREARIRLLFARRRLRMYPPDFGNSTRMVSVPLEEVAEGVAAMRRIVTDLPYRGIFSAEFKRDPRDGRLKLLEVNARPWWYVEFAARCGVDVVRAYYDEALGRPGREPESYRVGRELVYPYYDYHALRAEGQRGVAALARWAWRMIGAVQPVWTLDDPHPALAALAAQVTGRVTRTGERMA
jgi:predicted ATP-grasp superfamily ATP-dependent carboligase